MLISRQLTEVSTEAWGCETRKMLNVDVERLKQTTAAFLSYSECVCFCSSSSVPELSHQHVRLRVHRHRAGVRRNGKPTADHPLDEERRGGHPQRLLPDSGESDRLRDARRLDVWMNSACVVKTVNINVIIYQLKVTQTRELYSWLLKLGRAQTRGQLWSVSIF